MFGKLALRNVRRSARDYLVYVLTMTFVVSLMFAFNSIIFSKDLQKMYEMAAIMAAMIGIATFFIVLIVAWLINRIHGRNERNDRSYLNDNRNGTIPCNCDRTYCLSGSWCGKRISGWKI